MKASEHIKKLQNLIDKHGDHEIFIDTEDYPTRFYVEYVHEWSEDMIWEEAPDPPCWIKQYVINSDDI